MCTHHTHLLSGKGCAACFVRCHPCVSYCLAEETCRRPGPRATSGSVDVQLDWYSNAHKHQQMNTWKVPQDTSNLFSSSFHREERQRNWSAAEPRSSQSMLPQLHLWHILIIQLLQKTLPLHWPLVAPCPSPLLPQCSALDETQQKQSHFPLGYEQYCWRSQCLCL